MVKITTQRLVKAVGVEAIFGEFLNYKSGITTLVWLLEVPFLGLKDGHFFAKVTKKKWHFGWPIQNSKTTFIVQTFPKYGPYDFYLVNLSLLGAILAIFQFCGFSGLFWPFFPCKQGPIFKRRRRGLKFIFKVWDHFLWQTYA